MKIQTASPREFFLTGARLAFGLFLLYAGSMKIMGGPSNFVEYIVNEFSKTWSPKALNTFLAWLIIVSEVVIGSWLVSGIRQRSAWTAASLLMLLLTSGMMILGKPETSQNFQYFFLCLGCAAWASDKK